MMARTRLLRLALSLLCLPLLTIACQSSDPDPIPTAGLPTPDPPSSSLSPASPSEDETPSQEAITTAAQDYIEGRVLAEDLYKARDVSRVDELERYFTGSYLEFWREDLTAYVEADLDYRGDAGLSVVSAENYDATGEAPTFDLVTCLDFSGVDWVGTDGENIDKPFQMAIEDVTVQETEEGVWLASGAQTEPVDTFSGTECEESM